MTRACVERTTSAKPEENGAVAELPTAERKTKVQLRKHDTTASEDQIALRPAVAQAMTDRFVKLITQHSRLESIAGATLEHLMVICLFLVVIESRPPRPTELSGREKYWLHKEGYTPANAVNSPPLPAFIMEALPLQLTAQLQSLEDNAAAEQALRRALNTLTQKPDGIGTASFQMHIVWRCLRAARSIRTALPRRAPQRTRSQGASLLVEQQDRRVAFVACCQATPCG